MARLWLRDPRAIRVEPRAGGPRKGETTLASFGGTYTEEIDASRERCFALAADLDTIARWQPATQAVEVLEDGPGGRPSLVEMTIDGLVARSKVRLRFSYDEPEGLSWRREGGDLKSVAGSWRFEALDGDRTLATYSLEFDPGRVLSMLAKGPVVEKLQDHLGRQQVVSLKRVAESGEEP